MSRLFSLVVVLALASLTAISAAPAKPGKTADWPQFRGPKRDDHSPDKGLLESWPKEGPKLLWKGAGVGEGFSSVAVVGSRVFTMGDKNGSSHVFALSRDKGDILWSTKVGKAGGNYSGTRCTPTVDGDLVYGIGQYGDLVCLETKTGDMKWRRNFGKDFDGGSGGWNYTESPLIDGDRLVCTPGGSKTTMVALDKKTGGVIWKSPPMPAKFRRDAGYSSIVISNAANVKQYVQLTAAGTIGIAAKDGKLLWHYDRFNGNTANIPTPIVLGDQVFTAAGYGQGGALLTLSASGKGVKFKQEYLNRELGNKHGGVVIVGDYVYGDSDDSGNPYCAEWKTGKVKWTRRKSKGKHGDGGGSASVVYADGMLYFHYQNGWVSLVPANSESYVEKGGFKVPNGKGPCWAHPVVIGGQMYIRQDNLVWCYDVKGK
jgi:outer membrane protein assembly factor BamB